ncbi:MAG: amidohydrolase family protein [Massiliimalia sp.]|jgi:predicted TIM-barrel fold metal-dependent hydrolase
MLTGKTHRIDFHIHAFPDKIAGRTMEHLSKIAGSQPVTDGTVSGAVEKLSQYGAHDGVLMQIATKPSQQTTVNNWAASIQKTTPGIVCFGSVHPDAPDALDELERIRSLGLYGVKLHPDYQNFMVDDPKLFPIYDTIAQLHLPLMLHTGCDPVSPKLIHAPAYRLKKVIEQFPNLTVIAAHMGGLGRYDDTEEHLVGKNLYLDTSTPSAPCSREQALRIIRNHGAHRILFATDCPWSDGNQGISFLENLGLSDQELELIFHKNALSLLNQGLTSLDPNRLRRAFCQ